MDALDYVIKNVGGISIYALLNLLEHYYSSSIEELPRSTLSFKAHYGMAAAANDINRAIRDGDKVVVYLNVVGLIGVQGGSSSLWNDYIASMNLLGDYVARDFVDIFNHRVVQLRHGVRKQCNFSYFDREKLSLVTKNFCRIAEAVAIDEQKIAALIYKDYTRTSIKEILTLLLCGKVQVTIEGIFGRWINNTKNSLSFGIKLYSHTLGHRAWINDVVQIRLLCLDWATYDLLLIAKNLEPINNILSKTYHAFHLLVQIRRDMYRRAVLGKDRLGCGVKL